MSTFDALVSLLKKMIMECDNVDSLNEFKFEKNLETLYFMIEKCNILYAQPKFTNEGIYIHNLVFNLMTKPNVNTTDFDNYFECAHCNDIKKFIKVTFSEENRTK